MENQVQQPIENKSKLTRTTIIFIVILVMLGSSGFFLYKNFFQSADSSNDTCAENIAIVFEFQTGIDEIEAQSILDSYKASLRSSWKSSSNTINGSICIQDDGNEYLFDGTRRDGKENSLLEKLEKDNRFKKVNIETLSMPS